MWSCGGHSYYGRIHAHAHACACACTCCAALSQPDDVSSQRLLSSSPKTAPCNIACSTFVPSAFASPAMHPCSILLSGSAPAAMGSSVPGTKCTTLPLLTVDPRGFEVTKVYGKASKYNRRLGPLNVRLTEGNAIEFKTSFSPWSEIPPLALATSRMDGWGLSSSPAL